ncbi:MAG: ATP-binding protein [Planctomycetes bacterium]|nr:ATP-binding protein [Planctomycetota bacterium]
MSDEPTSSPAGDAKKVASLLLVLAEPWPELVAEAEKEELTTYTVTNAIAAREFIESPPAPLDAVFLTLDYPDIPGEDFLEWIKLSHPEIAVVVWGSDADEQRVMRCLRKGAADFRPMGATVASIVSAIRLVARRQKKLNETVGDMQVSMPVNDWVELVSKTESEYLGRIQRFCEVLFRKRLPTETVEDIRLAMEEFGRNAIEWGNRYQHEKQFSIRYAIIGNEMIIVFEDEGEGFDWRKNMSYDPSKDPMGHMKNRQAMGKRPGGFGLFMMRNMMDEVFYNAKGNVCVMKKTLNVTPGDATA